jgi:iron complex outermembrane receptor protein
MPFRRGVSLLLAIACSIRGLEAQADGKEVDLTQLSLQDLMAVKIERVSTPSRFSQTAGEAPSAVSVITGEEIKIYGHRTLADVLEGVRGLYVTSDRSYTYLGVRGFSRPSDYNSRVLLLVDGHRVNENLFGGAYIGFEGMVDVDLIDRVEVVRGPTSSLYGSGAFFGVVNVFTRPAKDLRHAEASFEAASGESYKGRFSYGGVATNLGLQLVLSGSIYDSAGNGRLRYRQFRGATNNFGLASDLDHEQARNLFGSLTWNDFTLSAAYSARKKEIPTASWASLFADPRYHTVDEHGYIDLKWQHTLNENHSLMARAYGDDYRYTADYPITPASPATEGLGRDDDLGQMAGGEAQWIMRWREHVLTLGGEGRAHVRQDQAYYEIRPRVVYLDDHQSSSDFGAYAQAEIAVVTNLHFNAGLRYDWYETFGGTLNPRLAVIYNPWRNSAVKFLYGTAYRAPNAFELYYHAPPESIANHRIEPETIRTYELVLEQKLAAHFHVSISGYFYEVEDLIDQVEIRPNVYQFRNTGGADALGVETELEWRHPSGVRARASYSLQHAENDDGVRLVNSPEHLAKANLLVPLWKDRLYTGLEAQYTGAMKSLGGSGMNDFAVVNWTLFSQRLLPGTEISASIYNLFDTHYHSSGGPGHLQETIAQDGRSFRVKLTCRF